MQHLPCGVTHLRRRLNSGGGGGGGGGIKKRVTAALEEAWETSHKTPVTETERG